jgi:hypothetical protein
MQVTKKIVRKPRADVRGVGRMSNVQLAMFILGLLSIAATTFFGGIAIGRILD